MRGLTRRGRLVPAALACLIVGTVVMVLIDATAARIVGVLLLVAFVVTGALAIASPEYLAREDDPDAP
ncbi:MAG: hypothetical protein AB7V42_05040 [Thermoleophilia bacterium]